MLVSIPSNSLRVTVVSTPLLRRVYEEHALAAGTRRIVTFVPVQILVSFLSLVIAELHFISLFIFCLNHKLLVLTLSDFLRMKIKLRSRISRHRLYMRVEVLVRIHWRYAAGLHHVKLLAPWH